MLERRSGRGQDCNLHPQDWPGRSSLPSFQIFAKREEEKNLYFGGKATRAAAGRRVSLLSSPLSSPLLLAAGVRFASPHWVALLNTFPEPSSSRRARDWKEGRRRAALWPCLSPSPSRRWGEGRELREVGKKRKSGEGRERQGIRNQQSTLWRETPAGGSQKQGCQRNKGRENGNDTRESPPSPSFCWGKEKKGGVGERREKNEGERELWLAGAVGASPPSFQPQ